MQALAHNRAPAPISRYLVWSAMVHVIVLALCYLLPLLIDLLDLTWLKSKVFEMKTLQPSIRVDLVAMPTLTPEEMKNLPQVVAKNEATEKSQEKVIEEKAAPVEEKIEKDEKQFNDFLKDFSKKDVKSIKNKKQSVLDSIKKGKENSKSFSEESQKELNRLILAGNKLAEGTSATGDTKTQNYDEFDRYSIRVREALYQYWRLPGHLMDKNLRCLIRLFIAKDGRLIKHEIYESSGNAEFDNRAVESVTLASPYPAPSEDIGSLLEDGQLLMVFPF
jgi:colicin import membrane protein